MSQRHQRRPLQVGDAGAAGAARLGIGAGYPPGRIVQWPEPISLAFRDCHSEMGRCNLTWESMGMVTP